MPDRVKTAEYIQQMYKYSKALVDMTRSDWLTRDKLGRSHHLQMEVMMHLQVIGEAASNLRRRGVELGTDIALISIAGLRNRISHDYEGVDWNIVEDVVFGDVPQLVENLRAYMNEAGIELIEIELDE